MAQRKQAVREGLVRAGRRLFSEQGLLEARIEDLAEHAGIGKGTLYLYFASREALAQAVIEAGFEDLGRRVEAAVARRRTLEARLEAVIQAHLEFFDGNMDLLRVFHQARGVLKFRRPEWRGLRRPLDHHVTLVAGLLAEGALPGRGRLSAALRRSIAIDVFGAVSGACSVRAALGASRSSDQWALSFRSSVTELAMRRARGGARTRAAQARRRA